MGATSIFSLGAGCSAAPVCAEEAPSVPVVSESAVLPVSVASAVAGCGGFGVSGTSVAGVDGWAVVVFLSPLQPEKNTVKKTKVKTVAE